MIKTIISIISILLLFCESGSPQRESIGIGKKIADLELNRREEAIGEKIKNRIEETLNRYYSRESYIVQVYVSLEKMLPTEPPKLSKKVKVEKETFLPGLPALPLEESSPELKDILVDQLTFSPNFRILSIIVNILLDERKFSTADVDFVKKVIPTCVVLDETRGDTLNVKVMPFPPSITSLIEKKVKEEVVSSEKEISIFVRYFPYLQIGLGILVLLLLGIMLMEITSLKKSKKVPEEILPTGVYLRPTGTPPLQAPPAPVGIQTELPKLVTVEEGKTLFYELRQLMVTTLVGNPEIVSEIFHRWVEQDKENGIKSVANFLKATEPRLIELLAPRWEEELRTKVESAMGQITTIEKDSVIETFKKFREEFQKEQEITTTSQHKEDIFYFLKQLEPHQVLHIIKDEPVGIIAIALAMARPDVSTLVMKELPQEISARIPVEMGKLKKIPLTTLSEIADRLSKKALQIESLKYVSTDGTKAIIDLLEHSSPEMEKQILANIVHQDLKLAEEIKKQYLTFDDLTLVMDKPLSEVLRTIDAEVIVKMLVGSPVEIKEKILANLPSRMKTIVTDGLSAIKEEISSEEIQEARKVLLAKLRDLAKSGKLELTKKIIS
ncbi:MAG TPA: hypothetical protein DHV62_04975 [Elusimicrobia bacterium]|jgi:flagellar motor switch protein FliG|nr:hypothetical protein [Elusimicrobiota bacterium]